MAGIGLYLLLLDREPGARVYIAATKREQTEDVWEPAVNMVRQNAALSKAVQIYKNKLVVQATRSSFGPLSSDAKTLDGLNISGAIVDELHAHTTPYVWQVIDSATSARKQPLIVAITTAGTNPAGVCFERHGYIKSVLSGAIEDDEWFGFIASIDSGDKWTDLAVWPKANPNMPFMPTMEKDLRSKLKSAQNSASDRVNFLIKHMCQWVSSAQSWLKLEDWDKCKAPFDMKDMAGRPAYAAFDLAENMDLTAACIAFPPLTATEKWRYKWRFFLPQDTFDRYIEDGKYTWRKWEESNELTVTPGGITDQTKVREVIEEWAQLYDLKRCGHDPWHGSRLAAELIDAGIETIKLPQNISTLSEASKAFEAQLATQNVEHNGESIMRWQIDNVALKTDGQGNGCPTRPQKNLNDRKIDGVAAAVMACALAVRKPIEVYRPLPIPTQI
jgi:phage terminase large subunit-like protein